MMATALLVLGLAATNAPPVQVRGDSICPTAAEVAAMLPELLPAERAYPDIAWIEAAGLDLQIELRSPTGEVRFSRRLNSSGTCADLATIAAVVIASWTSERNPDISLLQPGVLAPPGAPPSEPTAPPAPPAPAAQTTSKHPVAPPPGRTRHFDFAVGLGSTANSAGLVGAARVEVGMRGRRFGLRAGFAAETARDETIEARTVSWRRCGLSLGPTLTVVAKPVVVDMRADIFAGFTTVAGHGFEPDHQSSAVAPGLALAVRVGTATGWLRPWIEVGGQYWLASQEITITRAQQPNPKVPLPRLEARLFAGISIVLSR